MSFFTLKLDDARNALVILDQTKLPGEETYLSLERLPEFVHAIRSLQVRGAPAIGIAAAYGLYLSVRPYGGASREAFFSALSGAKDALAASRPTAVNLFWALDRVERAALRDVDAPPSVIIERMKEEALLIHREDRAACAAIGDHGLTLFKPGMTFLTHCNAGALAASEYGTALSPIYRGKERGYGFRVFADETRPLLQGARLTAWELSRSGVDVTLVCDGMSANLMQRGWIDACIVGCDRLAANGDAANKIGTASLAVVAKHYGVPFYVAAPTSTIDMQCASGKDITIEERDGDEVTTMWYGQPMAPDGVKTYNPAFDVTPADCITAIITEKGVVRPPYLQTIAQL